MKARIIKRKEPFELPSKPMKVHLMLLDKVKHEGTDIMSFKFFRKDDQNYLNYKAGQYSIVDLGTKEDTKGPTRAFTIASSPTEKDVILISTRIRDTPFKQKLAKLEKGTPVKITGPEGDFILPDDYSNRVVFLSGGIGVTPFRSMIGYATDKQLPLKITMFDSNRNEANILYKEEFDNWTKLNKNLEIIYTIADGKNAPSSDWKDETGFIDKAMLARYLTKNELNQSTFYICGPPAMLNPIYILLAKEIKIPDYKIKTEEFSGY